MISVIKKFNNSEHLFLYCSIFVFLIFLITRLPYYIYYPIHSLTTDSASYSAIALKIIDGKAPLLDMRTPGYPLFISLIWIFTKNFTIVFLIQSLLTLFTSIIFLRALILFCRSLAILFTIAISVFISSSYYLLPEISLLSELLFVVFLMLNCSLLIFALKKGKIIFWLLYSASFAFLVLIRPIAMFIVPGFLLIIIFFIFNKYELKYYFALLAPAVLILFSLSLYNYFTIKKFTTSPISDLYIAGVTVLFMEESPEYPDKVNAAIKKTLDPISTKDKLYIKNSFDLSKFFRIYNDNIFQTWVLVDNLMEEDTTWTYMDIQPILKVISMDALKRRPDIYTKIVINNLYQSFNNISSTFNFYDEIPVSYWKNIVDKKFIKELEDKEWNQFYSGWEAPEEVKNLFLFQRECQLNLNYVENNSAEGINLKDTFLKRVYIFYEKVYNYLFRNILWMLIFFASFFLSIYEIIRTKFKDIYCFIPGVFSVIAISNALVVSLFGTAIVRYTYVVEFVIYLSLPFLILLIKRLHKTYPL